MLGVSKLKAPDLGNPAWSLGIRGISASLNGLVSRCASVSIASFGEVGVEGHGFCGNSKSGVAWTSSKRRRHQTNLKRHKD